MRIVPGKLQGIFEISLEPRYDARGFFMRSYEAELMKPLGIDSRWVQENHVRTEKPGTVRGLHYQLPPFAETKLIRVIRGAILDVFVDLRKHSLTFGRWGTVTLSEENRLMLLVPKGFAHGYCTLMPETEVVYKADSPYTPQAEGGLLWNDQLLKIVWPSQQPILSDKDSAQQTFAQFVKRVGALDV